MQGKRFYTFCLSPLIACCLMPAAYLITLSARAQHVGRNRQVDLLGGFQVNY
jgi:hypothetical protein